MHSGAWSIGGNMFGQGIRFSSNLVLAWLLFREAFGLMALINISLQGLQMFSDVGIGPSIIQSKRGEQTRFVNTAWTIQVIRGFALWGIACIIAWPVALIYEDVQLAYLLPVAAASAAIAGFNSTSIFTLSRRLTIHRVIVLDIVAQVVAAGVMIVWALNWPSVWALVAGGVVASVVKMVMSHRLDPTMHNRFAWDREASDELFKFGRWIFISTVITFLSGSIDRLMLGDLLSVEALGVFVIAYNLARQAPILVRKLGSRVGFPAMSELYRRDFDRFRYRLAHIRLILALSHNGIQILLVLFGSWLVHTIYPEEFHDAGWMLSILAMNSIAGILNTTYGNAFMAMGTTFRVMIGVAAQLVVVVAASLIGFYYAGEAGYVYGLASVQWLLYPVFAFMAIRGKIWQPQIDLPILGVGGAICLAVLLN